MFDHLLRELYPTPVPPRYGLARVTASLYIGVRLDIICRLATPGLFLGRIYEMPSPWPECCHAR